MSEAISKFREYIEMIGAGKAYGDLATFAQWSHILADEVDRLEKELHAAKVELVMRGGQVEAKIDRNGVMMVSVVAKSGEPNANGDIFLDKAMSEAMNTIAEERGDLDLPPKKCQAIFLEGDKKK